MSSRHAHKEVEHGRVVGSTQASNGIPSLAGIEARGTASGVVADSDIVKNSRVGVQRGVDEADGALARSDTLLVDAIEDSSKNGSSSRRTTNDGGRTVVENDDVVTDGGYVRVSTTTTVVDAVAVLSCSRIVGSADVVGVVCRCIGARDGAAEIAIDGRVLVRGPAEFHVSILSLIT